ncbi:methylated-DNA--[protein]-cysteine S-methyltransferase [Acidobacteriia bacterium AH_259_A11_L15]|nr:methylated-DNA--[protein]-cysteine S-methyltransferase [Acidobacteriia bacterium AH_259_A11_L15]
MRETIVYTFLETPWCELTLASSSGGLCLVAFGRSLERARAALNGLWGLTEWKESRSANQAALEQLQGYFRGRQRQFRLALDLRGTRFQLRAWKALQGILYGERRTYRQLARAAGSPQGFRAAGMACHSNRVAIVVPCHRVVGSNGSLTGFGGGVSLKERLLAHEAGQP